MNQRRTILFTAVLLSFALLAAGCGVLNRGSSDNAQAPGTGTPGSGNMPGKETAKQEATKTDETPSKPVKQDPCTGLDTGGKAVLKSQTFPIDFAPFEGACFVTMHDPEHTDPPLGSEIGVFKDGTQIYRFESPFGHTNTACWVIAVGFRDVNEDGLKDIVVAGKCGAGSRSVITNDIQINDGRGFYSKVAANAKLRDLTTIKEITDFARKNKQLFER